MSPQDFPNTLSAPLFDPAATPPLGLMPSSTEFPIAEAVEIPTAESWLNSLGKMMHYFVIFLVVATFGTWYRVNSKEINASVAKATKFSKNPIDFALYMQGSDKTLEEMLNEVSSPTLFQGAELYKYQSQPFSYNPNQYQGAFQNYPQQVHIPQHGS